MGTTIPQDDRLNELTKMVSDTLEQSGNCAQTAFQALEYATSGGPQACTEVVASAVHMAAGLMARGGRS